MKRLTLAFISTVTISLGAMHSSPFADLGSGLYYQIIKAGDGKVAQPGDTLRMHYTGWLDDNGYIGEEFDSRGAERQFEFVLGAQKVIAGWDMGCVGMKVGEKRHLIVPAELGYGAEGIGPIPGGATLRFEIELVAILPRK